MRTGLCFHGIGSCTQEREPGESRYWVSEDVFLGVLDAVGSRADVELSFDDGNRSDIDIALPALRLRRLTATFFALAGRLDDEMSVGSADLRSLRDAGMRIGNHGWHHVPWRDLSAEDARRELVDARQVLEDAVRTPITEAALPLGRYDRTTLRTLRKAGYAAVHTSDRFPVRRGAWLRARYSVTTDDTVDSVMRIVNGSPGRPELRNLLASTVKRMR